MADVVVAADCSAVTPSAVLDRGDKCPNPAEKNRVLAKFFDSFVELLLVSLPGCYARTQHTATACCFLWEHQQRRNAWRHASGHFCYYC